MHHLPSRYIPCDGRLTASTYFDPRSPHGERLEAWHRSNPLDNFNPRSPHGERPVRRTVYPNPPQFQSTLPAGGATVPFLLMHLLKMISIHAPRGGERLLHRQAIEVFFVISIHAPRRGSDSTAKAYSNDRIKRSTLREPHFFYSKNACFSPIVSMCATTSRTKKSENQSFIRIISRLGPYVFHLRLVSISQIIEPYAVRLLVHQHFQCGTK